jgi:apolipoprotein N-acyltransferase
MFDKYLNNRLIVLYILPFTLGAITVFSFQPFNLTLINFFVLPIFFYLIFYIKKKSKSIYRNKPYKKNFFIFGTCFGFGFYLSGIYWINNSLTFDENFKFLIPFGLIALPLFLSLFCSILTFLIGPYINLNFRSLFFLSGGVAFSDYIRSKVLTGFPWNLWAYSFSWATEIIQVLNIIGLFAFNLLAITLFMTPAVIFFNISTTKKLLTLSSALIVLFSFYIYGNYSINQNQNFIKNFDKRYNIKVISPKFGIKYNLDNKQILNRFNDLVRYSQPSLGIKTLFIWPEGVFSGYSYEDILFLKESFSKYFSNNHYIVFGINKYDEKKDGFYNTVLVVNNNLEIISEYRKQKLVPFGEFIPFEKQLRRFGLKKITEGYGSFLKGNNQKNLVFDELNILPLICYETIFTEFIQKSDKETNLIINISEDGWFGDSIGPYQHYVKGIYRSIEKNSYFIRSANKGVSLIVNNKGEVIKKLSPTEKGTITLEVPLIKNTSKARNDLIFFALLITYIFIFNIYKKNNVKK